MLANRLKKVLPHIISESQSTFQSNKAISDNILMAFETLHHMKRKRTGKMGHMALKSDMSKAYDRLEWMTGWNGGSFKGSWRRWALIPSE